MSNEKRELREHANVKPTSLDPRYASARPWDWHVCLDCRTLVPVLRCPTCGGGRFARSPKAIIRQALKEYGVPPFPFEPKTSSNNRNRNAS